MVGGVRDKYYNSYIILNSPRKERKEEASGLILNIILAFLVVVISSVLLNVFQNHFLSKNSLNSRANESTEEIFNQEYIKTMDQCQYKKEPMFEIAGTDLMYNWS
jgi:uncharacterized protein YpmB